MLLAILCFSGLAVAQKLACQFDRGIDFSRFKIYQWVTVADNSAPNRITAQNIVNLINTDIAERVSPCLLLTTLQTFYVAYQVAADQQKQLNWFNDGGPWMGGFGQATYHDHRPGNAGELRKAAKGRGELLKDSPPNSKKSRPTKGRRADPGPHLES
jgi:hypothetical protein